MLPQSTVIVHRTHRSIRASEVNVTNENINIGRKAVQIVYHKNTINPYTVSSSKTLYSSNSID